jgi:hypothetical protein
MSGDSEQLIMTEKGGELKLANAGNDPSAGSNKQGKGRYTALPE